jgi:hypothetical protein
VTEATTTVIYLEVLSDLTNETLEWKFTDEELRRFLVPTNLTKRDGTRAEPVWLLHATSSSLKGTKPNHQHVTTTAMTTASTSITPKDFIRTAAAVLRAALVASCLRGALPRYDKSEFPYKEISVGAKLRAHLQWTCGRFAGDNDEIGQWSEWREKVFD